MSLRTVLVSIFCYDRGKCLLIVITIVVEPLILADVYIRRRRPSGVYLDATRLIDTLSKLPYFAHPIRRSLVEDGVLMWTLDNQSSATGW